MKKIISVFLVLTLVFAFSALFSGCHGSRALKTFVMPEKFDETSNIEITFWAKNDTNVDQVNIYKNAIENFEKFYPNVKVTLRLYTDYARIYSDVITNIPTNTTPNVCITYPDHVATYLTGNNTVVPLDSLMDDSSYGFGGSQIKFDAPKKSEIVQRYLSEGYFSDHCYALPFMRSTEACYINKTYVEKLGFELPEILTWDFIWEVSEAATAKDENGKYVANGQNVLIPFIYKSTDNMMIQYLRQIDAEYSSEKGDILIFNDSTKEFLFEIASHASTGAFSTFKISSYPANYLNRGQCIFAIDSTAGATWMGSGAHHVDIAKEDIVDFEIAVRMVPQVDPENPKMISQGPSLCIFNHDDPQEVLASWLFTQYLLSNEVQCAYSGTEGYIPVTVKAQSCDEYLSYLSDPEEYRIKILATELLINNIENTFTTPVFNGSASLREAAGQLIENVTKSVGRKETVDEEYMKKLFGNISSLYRLDQLSITENAYENMSNTLPTSSVILLSILAFVWICIILKFIFAKVKNKNKK